MEVYGTQTSPFTRIVRIVALEVGIDLPLREMYWRKAPEALFQLNPGGRVPLLVDGPRHLSESRAICAYLMECAQARPQDSFRPLRGESRWDEEHLLGIIYAALESVVVIRVLGDPPAVTHPYIERCRERIRRCFDTIDTLAKKGFLIDSERFGVAEAALITAADVIEGRGAAQLGRYSNVGAIRSRFGARPSIVATAPRFEV